ncbi:MAG: permease-like cell division protein FtsX [Ichthyobacteriaceae bacterium]|nr:permease-like cell division protein FtsX [Ichthyobacteriaceae bacterium]
MKDVNKSKVKSSYASVVVSISLVLFSLGIIGILLINAKKVSEYIKENFALTIYLSDTARKVDVAKLQKTLELAEFVRSTEYVTKEEAAKSLKKDLGEDFVDFLGYNPLKNSLDVHLRYQYVTSDYVLKVEKDLLKKAFISEVSYDKLLVKQMNTNIDKIKYWAIGISFLFLLISVALINSSIRLSVYSKRFTIRTMQLVGATSSFIRRPFIWKNIKLGLLGGFIAVLMISVALYYISLEYPIITNESDMYIYGAVFLTVILVGAIITSFSTLFALNKFLRLTMKELYN